MVGGYNFSALLLCAAGFLPARRPTVIAALPSSPPPSLQLYRQPQYDDSIASLTMTQLSACLRRNACTGGAFGESCGPNNGTHPDDYQFPPAVSTVQYYVQYHFFIPIVRAHFIRLVQAIVLPLIRLSLLPWDSFRMHARALCICVCCVDTGRRSHSPWSATWWVWCRWVLWCAIRGGLWTARHAKSVSEW